VVGGVPLTTRGQRKEHASDQLEGLYYFHNPSLGEVLHQDVQIGREPRDRGMKRGSNRVRDWGEKRDEMI